MTVKRREFLKGCSFVLGIAGTGFGVSQVLATPAPTGEVVVPKTSPELIHEYDWSKHLDKFLNPKLPVPEGKFALAHLHSSFIIKDCEHNRWLEDLITIHFDPTLMAMSRQFNNGEVFPGVPSTPIQIRAERDRIEGDTLRLARVNSMGLKRETSTGGRIPVQCTLSYNIKQCGTQVDLEAWGLELHKPKTRDPSKSPTVIGNYSDGHDKWVGVTDSNWEVGDIVYCHTQYYTVVEMPFPNKLVFDRPLKLPVDHGTPVAYAGFVQDHPLKLG